MLNLSVTIITYNEGRNIERCLRSVSNIADEILVVDSFSTDDTVEICRGYRARVIQHPFEGYGLQKDYAVRNAAYDYILSLDADEELSGELQMSIAKVKEEWDEPYYAFNRLNFYCGKPIKHGEWFPDRQVRLFDRRATGWDLREVHESVKQLPGAKPKCLKGDLNHYTCRSVEEHRQKEEKYAKMNAQIVAGRQSVARLTPYIKGSFRFFKAYVLKLGFLDGYCGWTIATTVTRSSYMKYKLARMIQKKKTT